MSIEKMNDEVINRYGYEAKEQVIFTYSFSLYLAKESARALHHIKGLNSARALSYTKVLKKKFFRKNSKKGLDFLGKIQYTLITVKKKRGF